MKPEGAQRVPQVSGNHFAELAIPGLQQDCWLSLMETSNHRTVFLGVHRFIFKGLVFTFNITC